MLQAKSIDIYYVPSETIEYQGSRESVYERFLKKGYYVNQERNGYWILFRPCQIIVTAHCEDGSQYIHDMKRGILEHYDRKRISPKLVRTFKKDFNAGKLFIDVSDQNYMIK